MRLFRLPELQATTELAIGIALIVCVVLGFVLHGLWEKHRKRQIKDADSETNSLLPYRQKPLLTDEEQCFYARLLPKVEQAGMQLLVKVRMADFISVAPGLRQDRWEAYHTRIQSKHADFLLVDGQTLAPRLLIEMQPSDICERQAVAEREMFIDRLCLSAGLSVIHIHGTDEWDKGIAQAMETARLKGGPPAGMADTANGQ